MINVSHPVVTLIEFFGMGLLLAFTPCVFPMVPILSGIIVGNKNITPLKSFQLSLTFVLSMAFTYAIAGVAAGYLGHTLQGVLQTPGVIIGFSLIFVLMALSMFGLFELQVPSFLQNYINKISNQQKSGSMVGVAVMGVLSTLIASPCVTAPLISVLTYISNSGNPVIGGGILFFLALGMGVPLLLFGMGQGMFLPKTGPWMSKVKIVFGMMMLGMAIWMLSRILSETVVKGLWLLLLVGAAFGLSVWTWNLKAKLRYMIQTMVLLGFFFGIVLIFNLFTTNQLTTADKLFTTVTTQAGLQQALVEAKKQGKPIIVDFYATWCSDCVLLDKNFFLDSKVQQIIQPFYKIRVDVSAEDSKDIQAIKRLYHVYGTPTVIFENKNARELAKRVNEVVSIKELTEIVNKTVE